MDILEKAKQKLAEQKSEKKTEVKVDPDKKEIKLVDLKPPKTIKKPPESKEFQKQESFIDFNKICRDLAEDLDYQRAFMKVFRNALPQIFGGIKTRVSKEEMSKEFNERVKTHFDMPTPLLNEMRKESDLFKKQKAKNNK